MFRLSLSTFKDRWQLFLGAIATLAFGVALVEGSFMMVASAVGPDTSGATPREAVKIDQTFEALASLMSLSAAIAALLTIFIVASTFAFSIAQRRRDLALMRLVGASRRQVRRLLLGEAVILGVVGVAVGVPLGYAVTAMQYRLVDRAGFVPPGFTLTWAWWPAITGAGTGLVVALVGVYAASRRAGRVNPMEALRDNVAVARVMTVPRWIGSIVSLALAVVAFVFTIRLDPIIGVAVAFGIIACASIALSLLSPIVVPVVTRLSGIVLRPFTLGDLTQANVRHAIRRTASTAAPVIVLIGLVVGLISVMGAISDASVVQRRATITADAVVSTTGAKAYRVASLPGVRVASPEVTVPALAEIPYRDTGEPRIDKVVDGIVAVDPRAYAELHDITMSQGAIADLRPGSIIVTEGPAEGYRVTLGDPVTVTIGDQVVHPRIVAALPEMLSPGQQDLLPLSSVQTRALASAPADVLVDLERGTTIHQFSNTVEIAHLGTVMSVDASVRKFAEQQNQTNVNILAVLLSLSGLYAAMGVINTLVMAGSERKREFAVLRLSGMTRRQVMRSALLESLIVGAIGLALGGLVVLAAVYAVSLMTAHALGVAVVSIPWPLVSAIALGSMVVVGATTRVTTYAATRRSPMQLAAARE
jgi:putative ABC transport system permease protein